MLFQGTYTAIVTPFTDGAPASGQAAIDWTAFDGLIDAQVAGGIDGIVPCGTTGESPSLSADEQLALIKRVVARVKGKVQIVAGTGSASTHHAIELSRAAEAAGADAVMVVVPSYTKPTQAGLRGHYLAVAKSVRCPVVVYNIPGRSGVDLLPDTLGAILEGAPNVVCVKEATGNVLRAQELVRRFGARLTVLSGDDSLTLAMVAVGAKGVISVTSNVLPGAVSKATKLALSGDFEAARRAHQALLPVHEAMFIEANPGPAKAALAARGALQEIVRGPLANVSDATKKAVLAALETYGSEK
jgi:4-hydroxy-tetrahydrodipicolinate synthase